MKAKALPLMFHFGCCAFCLLILSLSPAYPQPSKSNPTATQQVAKQDTPTYSVATPCFGPLQGMPGGALPASILTASLEKFLNKSAKDGRELVSVTQAPNLVVGKKPKGDLDIRTGCFVVILRK